MSLVLVLCVGCVREAIYAFTRQERGSSSVCAWCCRPIATTMLTGHTETSTVRVGSQAPRLRQGIAALGSTKGHVSWRPWPEFAMHRPLPLQEGSSHGDVAGIGAYNEFCQGVLEIWRRDDCCDCPRI